MSINSISILSLVANENTAFKIPFNNIIVIFKTSLDHPSTFKLLVNNEAYVYVIIHVPSKSYFTEHNHVPSVHAQ